MKQIICILLISTSLGGALAKETQIPQSGTNPPTVLKIEPEIKGPFKAPPGKPISARTTGQGFWKFIAATNLMPIPVSIVEKAKGAHGTIIVDAERDIVYWGLKGVGWVGFSNKLSQSWVVDADAMYARGNLHGSELRQRRGKLPLVIAADNEEGEVYLSDTTFQHPEKLEWPGIAPYTKKEEFHPTDATFLSDKEVLIEDGYGAAYLMTATISPFKYTGKLFGGKQISKTPHGVTYDSRAKTLLIAGRPEGAIKRCGAWGDKWRDSFGLPEGSTVCDVDVWEDYLLAPCLQTGKGLPGPIFVVNMKTKKIVSTLLLKEDLGLDEALHIHDATWYWMKNGKSKDLYVLFTNWNPGGIGALKLVSAE
jgi:hypothetical protein